MYWDFDGKRLWSIIKIYNILCFEYKELLISYKTVKNKIYIPLLWILSFAPNSNDYLLMLKILNCFQYFNVLSSSNQFLLNSLSVEQWNYSWSISITSFHAIAN